MLPVNVQGTSSQTYLWWGKDCCKTYKVKPGSLTTNLPIVGEGVDARELPKLPLLMKPFTAVPLVIPADDSPPFKASINAVNSCLKKNKVRGDFYPVVLSISRKFWLGVVRNSSLSNGTFQLHRPNPSHCAFGYSPCKQDTGEWYWKQQFCQMERDISVWSKWITFKGGAWYSSQTKPKWPVPFDFQPKFLEFWA